MRTNIRQVAALAGVSRTTVSNVLLGKAGRISSEKRENVLRAVEQLGYVPVRPSLQNRKGETRVIALALHDPSHAQYDFHSQVYAGICEAALRHDYDVLTILRAEPDWAVNRTAVRLLDRRADGILLMPSDGDNTPTLQALVDHRIPTVACYQREVPEGIAWVDPDNRAAIRGMVDLLVASGHQRIAHLTYNVRTQFDFRERRQAFIDSMASHGLEIPENGIVDATDQSFPEITKGLVATGATAVVCANDALAMRLWDSLESLGLRVPEDISITGIDGQYPDDLRALTTMSFPYATIGSQAVEVLIRRISGEDAADCRLEVPPVLAAGRSVR